MNEPVPITGIWLRRERVKGSFGGIKGTVDYAVVLAEIEGRWVEIIREVADGHFSHITEPAGIRRAAKE